MKRLLAVSNNFFQTGAPMALLQLLTRIKDRWDVTVVSGIPGPMYGQFLAAGLKTLVTQYLPVADVVLCNTLINGQVIRLAADNGIPSVWWLHEGEITTVLRQTKEYDVDYAYQNATKIVTPCEWAKRYHSQGRQDVVSIPLGIEILGGKYQPSGKKPVKLLQLGILEPRKGQDILCAAIKAIGDKALIDVTIAGANDLEQYVRSLPRLTNIRFLPGQTHQESLRLISEHDIVVVPSRDEVTPIVILEAMAMGRIVVASRIGGIPEMIEDGKTGFLFPKDDHHALADVLYQLTKDGLSRTEVGIAAQKFVREHRRPERFAQQFHELLETVCLTKVAPKPPILISTNLSWNGVGWM